MEAWSIAFFVALSKSPANLHVISGNNRVILSYLVKIALCISTADLTSARHFHHWQTCTNVNFFDEDTLYASLLLLVLLTDVIK